MNVPMIILFAVLVVWTLYWKGVALWKAARNNDTTWFVILLVLNTVGILDIIYIVFVAKKQPALSPAPGQEPPKQK